MRWPIPVLCAVVAATPFSASLASHTPNPASVTIAGNFQLELGCPDDWKPDCAATHLKFDPDDDVWQGTFNVPAGNWEYKAALDDSWTESYGGVGGANITLNLAASATVKFYYDHKTHWITSDRNAVIATAPGSYQSELGCPGDWQPDCLRSLLEDPDGDGIYKFTAAIPAGDYEVKVAINESWAENYGKDGASNGPNIPFTVATGCQGTEFAYDSASHRLTIGPAPAPAQPATVTIAGSLQSELGCSDDWQPPCMNTRLGFDREDGVWQGAFNVPAGDWEYKAALNGTWDENYGANAKRDGANIKLGLASPAAVKFYYDHQTHWVADNKTSVIAVAVGSFQSKLGCPGDWQPDCLRSWLQDPDGDGKYVFSTNALPEGNYEAKVAINESWDENYGVGGARDGGNIAFTVPPSCTRMFFVYDSISHVLTISASGAPKGNLNKAQAHWITGDTIAWKVDPVVLAAGTVALHYSAAGSLAITKDPVSGKDGVSGGTDIPLKYDSAGLPASVRTNYPHLASYSAFKLPKNVDVPEALKSQLAVSAKDAAGELHDATSLQIPGALDDLYTYNGPLGATFNAGAPTLRLWAPTARSVKLHLFNDSSSVAEVVRAMTPGAKGVWTIVGDASWYGKYYVYEVEVFVRTTGRVETNLVTDPYSVSLSRDSKRSHIVNLSSPALKPRGWDSLRKPSLDAPEDISLYELHVRDFSVNDATVPEALRGTFKAFTRLSSNGMRHLSALSFAGLTHVHLLPSFDIATINEDKSQWISPKIDLNPDPDSEQPQAAVAAVADKDGFNWGYDPWHYTVPEGSYSTNPDGSTRVVEFREMVQALAKVGLRTVMDVVYNHTNAAGQNDRSVLDRIVPGYYHRLNADGILEMSSCCANTASEHNMMEKLLIDSVLTWAKQYKVDGFRFDLMGHHMKRNMENLRAALNALTLRDDAVDGKKIYLYGEAWNFGEVADNARGVNAIQRNMAGTGIGSFNDRIRDGARGGGPFSGIQEQGFLTGLFSDPNDTNQGSKDDQMARLLLETDWVRCGMAGGLASFRMVDRTGKTILCSELDYNGQKTGYTADPQEIINYIEAHDNETLFDALQWKLPVRTEMKERVRVQNLGMSLLAFSQGVPFFHAGVELLRSKSGDRNSYNSGDWFNKLDFTYQANNWGVGLPPKPDNGANWTLLAPLLRDLPKASSKEILGSFTHMLEVLAIRRSTPLLRLRTAADINAKVQLLNGGPDSVLGLIAMVVQDKDGSVDRQHDTVAVLINGTPVPKTFTASTLAGRKLKIHPIHLLSPDRVVKTSKFDRASGKFTIPGRTAVVFWSSPSEHEGEQEGDH